MEEKRGRGRPRKVFDPEAEEERELEYDRRRAEYLEARAKWLKEQRAAVNERLLERHRHAVRFILK